ncbi:hypothetical protein GCM10009122_22630 [Fulvivirga kasyanovii]|uniref:Helix-turn-helix domain-containing protein n=1 Tax=Fulvivirga kasyanovii TaxID=396812 RepID=A0ABW9RPX6_9BACT|nr:hypothetical protein [Fulvivirga kasyanovii]MTI25751.1 hypothetical protein [Fulvivirga kasyanovii]
MKIINYSHSYKALDRYIEEYNMPRTAIADKLRGGVVLTAKEIIRIYGISLLKSNAIAPGEELPSLRTNSQQLAGFIKSSDRTIRRHINRLSEAGIITEKVWHGSNADYELWINTKVLYINTYEAVDKSKNDREGEKEETPPKTAGAHFENSERTKCPHTYAGNTKNNIVNAVDNILKDQPEGLNIPPGNEKNRRELSLTGVDITGNDRSEQQTAPHENADEGPQLTGNVVSGYTGEKVIEKNQATSKEKQSEAAEQTGNERLSQIKSPEFHQEKQQKAGNDTPDEPEPVRDTLPPQTKDTGEKVPLRAESDQQDHAARSTFLKMYSTQLWNLALNVLYKDRHLTESQIQAGEHLVKKLYEPVNTNSLARIHQKYVERIYMAGKFVQKEPAKRYVQLPDRYFSIDNPSGFIGTKKWYEKQKQREKEIHGRTVLRAQIRRLMNARKKGRDKEQLSLQLFRECETRVSKLNDPGLLDQFYAAVLDPQTLQWMSN